MSVPFDAVWSVFACHVGRGGQSLELVGTIARRAGSPLLGQFETGGSSESSGMDVCRRITGERHPTPEPEELHSVLRQHLDDPGHSAERGSRWADSGWSSWETVQVRAPVGR